MKLIGTKPEEVNCCLTDYYSVGHFIMGYVVFIISSIVVACIGYPNFLDLSIAITIIVGIVWELVENYVLINTGLKFEKRRDTLGNSLMDVVFVAVGGITCRIYANYETITFLTVSLWIIVVSLAVFDIFKRLTTNNK